MVGHTGRRTVLRLNIAREAFATGGFRVIGSVRARELPKLTVRSRPDVAVVYVGGEPEVEAAIGEIMTTEPCPVLLVAPRGSGDAAMRALAAGALEVITWPETAADDEPFRLALAHSARLVAGLALVTRRRRAGTPAHHASLRSTPDGARFSVGLATVAAQGKPTSRSRTCRPIREPGPFLPTGHPGPARVRARGPGWEGATRSDRRS